MSNETKFTKDNWVFREKTGEVGTIDQSDTQSYGMMLVICNIDTFDHPEHKANAHLIAAAPDLYEALEQILELGRKDTSNPKYDAYYQEAVDALAKARGEES